MKRLFAAVVVAGLAVGVSVGGPASSPAPTSAPPVSELVTRLGSEEFREREAAVAALQKAGPDAIPALREAVKSDNPEVRQRAAAILFKLQRAADSSARLTPKKVTLSYKDTPLGNAINDLRARTGLNIVIDGNKLGDPLRKVTCVTGEVSAWEALDAFCAAAGLKEDFRPEFDVPKLQNRGRGYIASAPAVPAADAVPITLVEGKHVRLPGGRDTAVRVLALPPSFPGHRVTLGTGEMTLCLDIAPTPGLNWQDVTSVKITKLIDDSGRFGGAGVAKPLAPSFNDFDGVVAWGGAGPGGFVMGGPGGMRFDPRTGMPIYPDTMPNPRITPVPLKIATPAARSIRRLEGSVIGEITLANQTLITVTDPAKNTGTAFDGPGQTRLTIQSVADGPNGASVQYLLEYPSPWSVGARRGWNPGGLWPEAPRANQTPTVRVYDAAGKQMPSYTGNGFANSSDDGQTMLLNQMLNFRKESGAPAKIVVTGSRPMIVEVPFVMENVPLP